jgi:starch synthase (maltosyl-transferring)
LERNLSRAALAIENVYPGVSCGRFPVKRVVGDVFEVWADIFKPGHDMISAELKYRKNGSYRWDSVPMHHFDNDRWTGSFTLRENARFGYTIEAWTDDYTTIVNGLKKWADAGEDLTVDLPDAYNYIRRSLTRANEQDRIKIATHLDAAERAVEAADILEQLTNPEFIELMTRYPEKSDATTYKILEVIADRPEAQFAAWYEMFHRSQGKISDKSATFKDCEARLPDIEKMGFNVIYLPPIHPIGRTNRKGANNATYAKPGEPGSPWAIGSAEGGHMAIHPDLGTMSDFTHFVDAARKRGIEIAIDIAFQCSPDHPYVREHPEWFFHRVDGSIRYAENPPKRYEDIYPLFFFNENWRELWEELKRVILFWVDKGVKTFRVDNPHTKPLAFWEWLIREVQAGYPDVIFFAEAFTRPKIMNQLAKVGFTQSYSYFTWRNSKAELQGFINEFLLSDIAEFYRANLFTNTPDILHEYLQKGGRPAFKVRLVLAATLSSVYGIYNGFELCENTAKAPGSEEYMNSEKYQYKVWDWDRPGNIKDYIAKINKIRRENPALHITRNLRLLHSDNDNIIFYGKWTRDNAILVAVNLDPYSTHESTVQVPIHELGLQPLQSYEVEDLLTGSVYKWSGAANYVRLDPRVESAHIFRIRRQTSA